MSRHICLSRFPRIKIIALELNIRNNYLMKTQNNTFNLADLFTMKKDLISRQNQSGMAIIMTLDDSNTFFKIDGLAGVIWGNMNTPVSVDFLHQNLSLHFGEAAATMFKPELQNLLNTLISKNFLENTTTPIAENKAEELALAFNKFGTTLTNFGEMKSFSLEQIESEVLNESIYLDVFAGSDLRLKKSVESLSNPLEKILALDGISYLWNESAAASASKNTQVGFVAQQVAAVIPDLVKKDTETGYLAINYTKLTPYLVESIKELKSLIDSQHEKINQLESDIRNLKQ